MKKSRTVRKRKPPSKRELSELIFRSLLGSWKLLSYEHLLPSGKVEKPFGDAPSGMIVYQPDGHMSVQISVGKPPKTSSTDFFRTSAKDAARAWRNYFGYWGTYRVDPTNWLVVHRVEGSSFANWIGTEQVRNFVFEAPDRLVLETTSEAGRFTVTWRRTRTRKG